MTVTNTGQREGEEVVQMYVHQRVASVTRPVLELRGFSRITLKPGEQRTIDLPLTGDALSMLDVDMKRVVEPGIFEIILGTDSKRTTEALLQVEAASSPQGIVRGHDEGFVTYAEFPSGHTAELRRRISAFKVMIFAQEFGSMPSSPDSISNSMLAAR